MTVGQNRVLRVAAWVAAVVGALLLVLTFVLSRAAVTGATLARFRLFPVRGEYYLLQLHSDLLPYAGTPVPAVVVLAWRLARWWPSAWCMPASKGSADPAVSRPPSRWHCCRWRLLVSRGCGGGIAIADRAGGTLRPQARSPDRPNTRYRSLAVRRRGWRPPSLEKYSEHAI